LSLFFLGSLPWNCMIHFSNLCSSYLASTFFYSSQNMSWCLKPLLLYLVNLVVTLADA
jgi:hypothetical protein